MPITVELQTKWAPGGYARLAQSHLFVDEVGVIMQAFSEDWTKKGLMGFFIMPRFVGRTGPHRGKDLHQPRMLAALSNYLGHKIFFADVRLVDVFYRYAMRIGEFMCALANALAQWIGENFGIIEYLDMAGMQEAGHATRVTGARQCARNNHSIIAGKHAKQFGLITFSEQFHNQRLFIK